MSKPAVLYDWVEANLVREMDIERQDGHPLSDFNRHVESVTTTGERRNQVERLRRVRDHKRETNQEGGEG